MSSAAPVARWPPPSSKGPGWKPTTRRGRLSPQARRRGGDWDAVPVAIGEDGTVRDPASGGRAPMRLVRLGDGERSPEDGGCRRSHPELRHGQGPGPVGSGKGRVGRGGGSHQHPGVPSPDPGGRRRAGSGSPDPTGCGRLRRHEHHDALGGPLHRVARGDGPSVCGPLPVDQPGPGCSCGSLVCRALLRRRRQRPPSRDPPHGPPHRPGCGGSLRPRRWW